MHPPEMVESKFISKSSIYNRKNLGTKTYVHNSHVATFPLFPLGDVCNFLGNNKREPRTSKDFPFSQAIEITMK